MDRTLELLVSLWVVGGPTRWVNFLGQTEKRLEAVLEDYFELFEKVRSKTVELYIPYAVADCLKLASRVQTLHRLRDQGETGDQTVGRLEFRALAAAVAQSIASSNLEPAGKAMPSAQRQFCDEWPDYVTTLESEARKLKVNDWEELVGNLFWKLFKHFGKADYVAEPEAYFKRALENSVKDEARADGARLIHMESSSLEALCEPTFDDPEGADECLVNHPETRRRFREMLVALPAENRDPLIARIWDGFQPFQIFQKLYYLAGILARRDDIKAKRQRKLIKEFFQQVEDYEADLGQD